VGLTVHWLSVNGVQPEIPQNPSLSSRDRVVHRVEQDDEDDDDENEGNGSTAANVVVGDEQASTDVHVHQLLPRLLSEELQLYFTKITLSIERTTNPSEQDAAIASVGRDLGLQELVPFLIRYITKELYRRIGNIEHCRTLIRLAQALLRNPHLHVELHVRVYL
jgi:transcription initiation factor TFIID subunit 6